MTKGKKIGIIIGVIIAVFIISNVPFWMNPELITEITPEGSKQQESIQSKTTQQTTQQSSDPFVVWTNMQLECEKYGSPQAGFESLDAQNAFNDCMNKANSWYLVNSED